MIKTDDLLGWMDLVRLDASRKLEAGRKAELGQFLTPAPIARLMASMPKEAHEQVHLLDPGAGVGTLFAAAVAEYCRRDVRPQEIRVTAYEIDTKLAEYLPDTFRLCEAACRRVGIRFTAELVRADFLACAADLLAGDLFTAPNGARFTCALLNPPYRKINSDSEARCLLRRIGVETSNLYTGFMTATVKLLEAGGEMVAITPRSFANGRYFRPFRRLFLQEMTLLRLHVFESRQQAFREDEVLQENVIVHAVKGGRGSGRVFITSSAGPDDPMPLSRVLEYERVIRPGDPECFIHITPDDLGEQVASRMAALEATLADLGLTVSTGRVVDFRVRSFLRPEPGVGTAPLIWPTHFDRGSIAWPKEGRKPNAIADVDCIRDQLVPNEPYVLVRRFSAKEERRRVVAAVYDPASIPTERVGFENHLNYYHRNGGGIDLPLARGLAAFLNSTLVDVYIRQFNGHTQVNATDLRCLRYPKVEQLRALGRRIGSEFPAQVDLDELVDQELISMVADPT